MTAGASTTVDAASGAAQSDPYVLNVAATTNILVGDNLFLTSALGQTETIEVHGVTSTVSVRSVRPIKYNYASADTVVEKTYTYPLTATHTATSYKFCEAKMLYTAGGVARVEFLPFHIKKRVLYSQVNEQYLYDLFPDLDRFEKYQTSFTGPISAAFDQVVSELISAKLDADNLRPGRIELAHAYKAFYIIAQRWSLSQPGINDYLASILSDYDKHFKSLLDVSAFYDANEDGVTDSDEVNYLHGYWAQPFSYETENPNGLDAEELTPLEDRDPKY